MILHCSGPFSHDQGSGPRLPTITWPRFLCVPQLLSHLCAFAYMVLPTCNTCPHLCFWRSYPNTQSYRRWPLLHSFLCPSVCPGQQLLPGADLAAEKQTSTISSIFPFFEPELLLENLYCSCSFTLENYGRGLRHGRQKLIQNLLNLRESVEFVQ